MVVSVCCIRVRCRSGEIRGAVEAMSAGLRAGR